MERLPGGTRRCTPSEESPTSRSSRAWPRSIREQALHVTHQEVPHSIAVVIEEMEREGELVTIHASLIVERDSQKGIVIGKGGGTLKKIGTRAREEMELLLGAKVFLDLRVKVAAGMAARPEGARAAGVLDGGTGQGSLPHGADEIVAPFQEERSVPPEIGVRRDVPPERVGEAVDEVEQEAHVQRVADRLVRNAGRAHDSNVV